MTQDDGLTRRRETENDGTTRYTTLMVTGRILSAKRQEARLSISSTTLSHE